VKLGSKNLAVAHDEGIMPLALEYESILRVHWVTDGFSLVLAHVNDSCVGMGTECPRHVVK
jgi:hypothetical protein